MSSVVINWKRNAIILALTEFQVRSMMMLVRPYIPLYLPELGVIGAADIAYWTGLITSINFISQAATSPFWGSLADRVGRKWMVIRCIIGMSLFSLLLALATNAYQFLIIRFIMGAVSGVNAAATTLVATNTPEKHMGYAIGLIQTGFMAGTLAGPAMGAIIGEVVGYRGSFVFSGIAILLLLPLVIFGVKEDFKPVAKVRKEKQKWSFGLLNKYRSILFLMFLMFIVQICMQGNDAFIPLFVKDIYEGLGLNVAVAVVFGASAGATVFTTSYMGKIGDRIGNLRIITLCLLGFGMCIFLQSLITNIYVLVILRLTTGVFIGGIIPNIYTGISKLTQPEVRGSVLGITTSVVASGSFCGPLASGVIAANHGIHTVFITLGILLLLTAVFTISYLRYLRSKGTQLG